MSKGYDLSGYIEVSDRIATFKRQHPEGSLQSILAYQENPPGWLCKGYAYRTPDDPRPGIGHAFEPVPGKTPYTRDSEAMNAETSAWGRAIVALGFETKHLASANEVRNRQTDPAATSKAAQTSGAGSPTIPPPTDSGIPFGDIEPEPEQASFVPPTGDGITDPQVKMLGRLMSKLDAGGTLTVEKLREGMQAEYGVTSKKALTKTQASDLIKRLKALAGEE